MTQSSQHTVNEAVKRIEPTSQLTWPARETVTLEGWRLRFSGGHSHRVNSVAAFAFVGRDVEPAIGEVESQYRQRGQKPMFQVTAAAEPADLALRLAALGYRATTPSLVMTASAADVRSHCARNLGPSEADLALSFTSNPDFDALVVAGSHSQADGRERLETLTRIAVPMLRVTVFLEGRGVCCGMAAGADGLAGINLMRTHPDFRRRGFAQRVLGAIAEWSLTQSCPTLYLSVEQANAPARALYDRVGFQTAYDYMYYVQD